MAFFLRRFVSNSFRLNVFRRAFSNTNPQVTFLRTFCSPSTLSRICSPISLSSRTSTSLIFSPSSSQRKLPLPSCSYATSPSDDVVFEVTASNIRPNVINGKKPVVLYCTANWCTPCKQFGPRLEKDIRMFNGAIRLGKMDVDREQQLAADLKIQSVPTVVAFAEGRPIASFVGVPDEKKYKAFLDSLADLIGDKDSEATIATADALLQEGKIEEASKLYGEVFEINDRENDTNGAVALAGLVQCLLKQGNASVAKDLVSNLKSRFKSCLENGAVKSAISALELLETFGGDTQGNPEELKKIIAADPNRLEEKYSLASIYLSQGKHQDAINLLLDIIKRDRHWKDDAARELLLKIFTALGATNPMTVSSRQRLTSIWFA